MYKRVLLAYDGSRECAIALREGALLARACGAEVILLSVVPETAGVMIAESAYGGVVASQSQSFKELLEGACSRLKQLGFKPTAKLVAGEPIPVIAAVAKEVSADLVIVGHHTKNFLARWWSPSAQDYLSDHVGCSLLISRNPMSDEDFEAACQKHAMA